VDATTESMESFRYTARKIEYQFLGVPSTKALSLDVRLYFGRIRLNFSWSLS